MMTKFRRRLGDEGLTKKDKRKQARVIEELRERLQGDIELVHQNQETLKRHSAQHKTFSAMRTDKQKNRFVGKYPFLLDVTHFSVRTTSCIFREAVWSQLSLSLRGFCYNNVTPDALQKPTPILADPEGSR
jgi:hypothetical protein